MPMLKTGIAVLISLTATIFGSSQANEPVYTISQLKEDYLLFQTVLKEAHPGVYRYQSKDKVEEIFKKTSDAINRPMTEKEFYSMLTPVVAGIQCGHTKWFRKDRTDDRFAFHHDSLFPLKLYFVNNKAYILESANSFSDFEKGDEVLTINGKSISEIIKRLSNFIFVDGKVQSAIYEELNQYFNGLYATFIEAVPVFTIGYRSKGVQKIARVLSVNYEDLQSTSIKGNPTPELPIKFTLLGAKLALLEIKSFSGYSQQQNFYAVVDSVFAVLKTNSITDLIIDVRDNEGGEESYGGYLYSYLTGKPFRYYDKITVAQKERFSFVDRAWLPAIYETERLKFVSKNGDVLWEGHPYLREKLPQANGYTGKLYVLINGKSFSVTSEFASMLHHSKRAVFIGEETGGGYYGNNSGVFTIVSLPHTKLTLGVPLLGFYTNVIGYPYNDRGILPDHEIKKEVKDMVNGKDAVMEYTLRLIRDKKAGQAKQ